LSARRDLIRAREIADRAPDADRSAGSTRAAAAAPFDAPLVNEHEPPLSSCAARVHDELDADRAVVRPRPQLCARTSAAASGYARFAAVVSGSLRRTRKERQRDGAQTEAMCHADTIAASRRLRNETLVGFSRVVC